MTVADGNGGTATSNATVTITNVAPTVTLTAPENEAVYGAPASFTVNATASDPDGTVVRVDFYRNGTILLGSDDSSPYSVTVSGLSAGTHAITAVAFDSDGASVTSGARTVLVRTPVVLGATADTYVTDGQANKNFGTATTMQVRTGSAGNNRWTYLKFDLSTVAAVNGAKLRLRGNLSATGATVVTSAYGAANTTWTETGLTWSNKPASGTSALASVTMANSTTPAWYEWDLTSYLAAEKAAGRNVVTIVLKNNTATAAHDLFSSRQATTNRPDLVVVP